MKMRLLLVALALLSTRLCAENEIGFIEKFALAPDREAVLSELLPGSEESYFYHALHFQNTRQAAKLAAIMEQWAKRFPDSQQRRVIENREALLSYDASPAATLQFLRDRLQLDFNHQQQARDQRPNLPTALDPAQISTEAFAAEALRHGHELQQFSEAALEALVRQKAELSPAQRRALLSRLTRPELPGLLVVIEADLRTEESKGFGEFAIHRALLPEQLDDLAKRIPTLIDNQAFVYTRLRKLAPSVDVDLEFDLAEREAWLERLWSYARNLNPAFNTLKAHILFTRLQLDRTRGVYNRERLIEYLKLPRHLPYVSSAYLQPGARAGQSAEARRVQAELVAHPVDLNADLAEVLITTAPIRDDEAMVREYLLQIFKTEPEWQPFAVYLRESWVKEVFAEAKMLHGIGNSEQWAALIPPARFQQIKERVEIAFAPANPRFHAPGSDVALEVWLKNAPKLIVKIYEMNTLSFFLNQNRQLNTDVSLDGLVANVENTYDFSTDAAAANPFRRVPRRFEFPALKGRRGAWIVELIGGGKSSRVLIRKGQWQLLQRTGPAGDVLTVLDEERKPVADAAVWMEGRRFTTDAKSGQITVPFTSEGGSKPIILSNAAGDFATLTTFEHHEENYRLEAQFHVSREQLLSRREATLAVRPALLVGEAEVPLGVLQEPRLTLTTTTHEGISTTQEITAISLDAAKELLHTFVVPERLAMLTATLSAKIEKLSAGGEKIDLSASHTWHVNGLEKTEATSGPHLSNFGGSYVLELLGKNGEPLADQQVVFDLRHHHFTRQVTVALRTDERGRITLGTLPMISSIQARMPNGRTRFFSLQENSRTTPPAIHARAGEPLQIPVGPALDPESVSLLELRSGSFALSHTAKATTADAMLSIPGLPPGDYSLRVRDPEQREVPIHVTAGEVVQNWIVSPTRALELRNPQALQITGAALDAENLAVRVRNANRFTRVQIAASRFVPSAAYSQASPGSPASLLR
jgi:hypothetical protein